MLWHAVLLGVAEGLPPLAPDWFPDLGASLVNIVCATVVLVLLYTWRLNGEVTGRGRRWYLALRSSPSRSATVSPVSRAPPRSSSAAS